MEWPAREEAIRSLARTDEELLTELGHAVVGVQAAPLTKPQLKERGVRWLDAQTGLLATHVCGNPTLRRLALKDNDDLAIAVELAGLLASLVLPVEPMTLSVLLLRRGLKALCANEWGSP